MVRVRGVRMRMWWWEGVDGEGVRVVRMRMWWWEGVDGEGVMVGGCGWCEGGVPA